MTIKMIRKVKIRKMKMKQLRRTGWKQRREMKEMMSKREPGFPRSNSFLKEAEWVFVIAPPQCIIGPVRGGNKRQALSIVPLVIERKVYWKSRGTLVCHPSMWQAFYPLSATRHIHRQDSAKVCSQALQQRYQ
jgi:hypothetical protein